MFSIQDKIEIVHNFIYLKTQIDGLGACDKYIGDSSRWSELLAIYLMALHKLRSLFCFFWHLLPNVSHLNEIFPEYSSDNAEFADFVSENDVSVGLIFASDRVRKYAANSCLSIFLIENEFY